MPCFEFSKPTVISGNGTASRETEAWLRQEFAQKKGLGSLVQGFLLWRPPIDGEVPSPSVWRDLPRMKQQYSYSNWAQKVAWVMFRGREVNKRWLVGW